MKRVLEMLLALLMVTSTAMAAVWNTPQDGATVGSPTYLDCTAPIANPAYMKLWIDGVAVLTVHDTNRMAFVTALGLGARRINCQYNDGVNPTFNNVINIQVVNNIYSQINLDEDPEGSPYWEAMEGCSGSCTLPFNDTDPAPGVPAGGTSRYFTATRNPSGGSFQDVYWFEKRCTDVNLAGRWVMQFDLQVSSDLPRAFEWGITQLSGSTRYRMAYQANYASNVWKIYDPSGAGWVTTNVPFSAADFPAGFSRVYLVAHPAVVNGQNVVVPDAIQIGTANAAKVITSPAFVNTTTQNSGCGEYNTESVQIDLDTSHTTNKIWMNKIEIHFQP